MRREAEQARLGVSHDEPALGAQMPGAGHQRGARRGDDRDGDRGPGPWPAALSRGTPRRRRAGTPRPARSGPVPHYAEASQSDDGAVLFVTSALQGSEATGIAAAANAVDGLAAAAARAAVEEWSATVGTHRLLGGVSPWCEGAVRAL